VLDKKKASIQEERIAKKAPMSDAEAKALLKTVSKVIVAKGKAMREMAAGDATVEDLRGPTGNIRAPLVRKGKTLLVGFNDAALAKLL
jgi:arsenate reductase-like glutaredoxin family protein